MYCPIDADCRGLLKSWISNWLRLQCEDLWGIITIIITIIIIIVIITFIVSSVTVLASVPFVHQRGANHAPGASVTHKSITVFIH